MRDFLKVIPVVGLSEGAARELAKKGRFWPGRRASGHARSLDLRR